PLVSAGFLVYMVYKSLVAAPSEQRWSMLGIAIAGIVLMLVARFVLQSWFFQIRPGSAPARGVPAHGKNAKPSPTATGRPALVGAPAGRFASAQRAGGRYLPGGPQ